jgi:hypothetical protein
MTPTPPILDAARATIPASPATAPRLAVTHDVGSAVSVSTAGVELLRYTYRPDIPAFECPAPYFHPLRDLAGEVVTGNRPHDHRWHKGLAMTASHLSGGNFWGGGSYTPGPPVLVTSTCPTSAPYSTRVSKNHRVGGPDAPGRADRLGERGARALD